MRKVFSILFFYTAVVYANDPIIIPPVIVTHKINFSNNASTQIITRSELQTSGVTNLAQALQELGALQLQDSSGNSSQAVLSMRGFGANASSNTLILINGIPLTNPDMASPDLNLIPMQNIQLIEIISGSQSVTYGDQAVGGIINIITSPKIMHKINAACSLGSYDATKCYANFNSSFGAWEYSLNGITNRTNNYRDHNEYSQHNIFGNVNYDYVHGKINFNYYLANEKLYYPGALTHTQVVENRQQSTNNTDFFQDRNGYLHLENMQHLSENFSLQWDLARRQMNGNGVLSSPFTQSRAINFLKPVFIGSFPEAKFKGGLDFEKDTYNLTTDFGITNVSQNKYGAFGIIDYALKPCLILNAGIRGAQQNNQQTSFTDVNSLNRAVATTIGLKYIFSKNLNLYVSRAGSFRFPKADENADVPPGVNYLKTQRGVSYEGGLQWDSQYLHSNAEIYQLNLRDEIQFDPFQTPQDPFGTNQNLDPTVRKGFLLSAKYLIKANVTLGLHYNYVNARFQNGMYSGKRIPLVAENIIRGDVNYVFHDNWNFFAEAIYTGNEFPDNDNANITGVIGGYTIYNFNISYRIKNFLASFRINNIFNKEYYSYTVYQASLVNVFFYPAPERNYSLNFKLELL